MSNTYLIAITDWEILNWKIEIFWIEFSIHKLISCTCLPIYMSANMSHSITEISSGLSYNDKKQYVLLSLNCRVNKWHLQRWRRIMSTVKNYCLNILFFQEGHSGIFKKFKKYCGNFRIAGTEKKMFLNSN